ncbi:hypothetical protein BDW66DRAFT_41628 [Aspergillus desertorum]
MAKMSSSAYSKRFELPWTPSEKQRLWKLKTTGETKDLSWSAFHKLKHFPQRSNSAVQVQWSRLRAEQGLPRQKRARGSLDGAVPAKRSAAHLEDVRESANHRRAFEDAVDDERSGNGVDIPDDNETTENEGATPDDSAGYQNHDSQAPDETQRISMSGPDSQQATPAHFIQSSATVSGPGATTPRLAPSIAFTPLNINSTAHVLNIRQSWSTPSQAPQEGSSQTENPDEHHFLEPSGISSKESPHTEWRAEPEVSNHLNPESLTDPTAAEREPPHPLGLSRDEEQLAAQVADHQPPAPSPSPSSPRLEKASEALVSHVKIFTEEFERRINDLISGASLQQKELSLLQNSHKEVLLERDELREKLNAEIREKEGYKKESEDLMAELKQIKEEMRKVEEDKKKISGVCKTLEELVGFMKH